MDVKGVLKFLSSLYPNRAFALVRENMQNSIDARAKNIWITLRASDGTATFVDDGSGISIARMNEREYFALMWSTKRGKDLIGSKGIGRLTNIAAAKTVIVESHDGRHRALFNWYSTGRFSKRRAKAWASRSVAPASRHKRIASDQWRVAATKSPARKAAVPRPS